MSDRRKGTGMLRWEYEHGDADVEAEITRLYTNRGVTQHQVAAEMGISPFTLNRWMKQLGIPARRQVWIDTAVAV